MAGRPVLLIEGEKWLASMRSKGVPILRGWDIQTIAGEGHAQTVIVDKVDANWRPLSHGRMRHFAVDSVCMGYGLAPATEFYRLLGAEQEFVPDRGGWAPRLDEGG